MQHDRSILSSIKTLIQEDKKQIFYLIYYSTIEAILLLSIPLASSFMINSILAHASISIAVLGGVIITTFLLAAVLQVAKQYIVEKFQQKVFVTMGIKIASQAIKTKDSNAQYKDTLDKHMNYFFDIEAIQKIFPIMLLDGTGLIVKLLLSLLLLLAFDVVLFQAGLFFFILFVILLFALGRNGISYSIERSNAKHEAIYYLQNIPQMQEDESTISQKFDEYLQSFIQARTRIFKVILSQLTLTYLMEGLIFSSFMIIGGYLVIHSTLPLGEFVAAEIIVVTITYALKSFMKQIDYIYDMAEGFYKVEKLSSTLEGDKNA